MKTLDDFAKQVSQWRFNLEPICMLNPDEVRSAFNKQYAGHGGSAWVRLNLSTGPVLARRNIAHHTCAIYIAIVDGGMVRHYMVTIKRQLKSNGSSTVTPELNRSWVHLIGYTEREYNAAKNSPYQTAFTMERIRLYEQGRKK